MKYRVLMARGVSGKDFPCNNTGAALLGVLAYPHDVSDVHLFELDEPAPVKVSGGPDGWWWLEVEV